MEYVNIERVLEIIENGEYDEITTYVNCVGATQYNVKTNNGGIIRLVHGNKVWWTKEYVDVILFAPDVDDAIYAGRCKSDDVLFDRIYNAWKKVVNDFDSRKKDEYSKFF